MKKSIRGIKFLAMCVIVLFFGLTIACKPAQFNDSTKRMSAMNTPGIGTNYSQIPQDCLQYLQSNAIENTALMPPHCLNYINPNNNGVYPGLYPNQGNIPGVYPGVQPGIGGIQPGIFPGVQPGVQPGVGGGLLSGIFPGLGGLTPGAGGGLLPGLFNRPIFGGGPCVDPCYDPCFDPCYDPCFDPCANQGNFGN